MCDHQFPLAAAAARVDDAWNQSVRACRTVLWFATRFGSSVPRAEPQFPPPTHFPWRSLSHVRWRWQRLRRQNWQPYAEHAERMLVRRAHRQGRLLGLFVLVSQVDTVCASLVRSSWVKIVSRVPSRSTAEPPKLGCVLSLLSVGWSSFPWTISLPLRPWRSSGRQLPGARARLRGTSPASLLEHRWEHRWFSLA